jgi:hypothetical protein
MMSHLIVLAQDMAICRLPPEEAIPPWVQNKGLTALVRTADEFSIVCNERYVPGHIKMEKGWRILKVQGPLEFSQVGVLAAIAMPLAQSGVSIFVLSTFDTDYILVKESSLLLALDALKNAGHTIEVASK